MISKKLSVLMLAIIVVGVAHMGEQVLFGIEEYHMLRDALGGWYAMYPASYADRASVWLITLVVTTLSLVFLAMMRGGVAPLIVAGVFGVLGVSEAHHLVEAAMAGSYDPGLVTSLLYVVVGGLILLEVARELRRRRPEPTRP